MKATTCPNLFPTRLSARRIAIIGEAPGTHELSWVTCEACHHSFTSEYTDIHGTRQDWKHCDRCGGVLLSTPTPFVGPAGRLLGKLLDEVGIQRTACFIGNVGQVIPPRGDPRQGTSGCTEGRRVGEAGAREPENNRAGQGNSDAPHGLVGARGVSDSPTHEPGPVGADGGDRESCFGE